MKLFVCYYYVDCGDHNETVITGISKTKPKYDEYEEYDLK